MQAARTLKLTNRGELQFFEGSAGAQKVVLRGPAALASDYTLTLPDALPVGVAFVEVSPTGDLTFTETLLLGSATLDQDVLDVAGDPPLATVEGSADFGFVQAAVGANAVGTRFAGFKTRSVGSDANTVLHADDRVLEIPGYGADGAQYQPVGEITYEVDATPDTDTVPGRLVFRTSRVGSGTLGGAIAFYRLQDDYTDFFGLGPTLTGNGSPAFFDAHLGRGVAFGTFQGSGSSSTAFATDELFSLDGVARTMAGWFFADDYSGNPGILSNWGNMGSPAQWLFWHDGTHLVFQIRDASNNDHTATYLGSAPTDQWVFFCLKYDPATGDFSLRIDNNAPVTGNTPSIKTGAPSTLELGNRNGTAAALKGGLDAVGFWPRLLSTAEIDALYNSGTGLEPPFGFPAELVEVFRATNYGAIRLAGLTEQPSAAAGDVWYLSSNGTICYDRGFGPVPLGSKFAFDVREYGAVGDGDGSGGGTDDTTAIQDTIDACVAAGGGVVFFPAGHFNHTGLTCEAGIELCGVGTATVLDFTPSTGNGISFTNADADRFALRRMKIRSAGSSTGWAVQLATASGRIHRELLFEDLDLNNFKKGIEITSPLDVAVRRVRFNGPGSGTGGSVGLKVGTSLTQAGNAVTVERCYLNNYEHLVENWAQACLAFGLAIEQSVIGWQEKGAGPAELHFAWVGSTNTTDVSIEGGNGMLLSGYGSQSYKISYASAAEENRSVIIPERMDTVPGSVGKGAHFGSVRVYNAGSAASVNLGPDDVLEWRDSRTGLGTVDTSIARTSAGYLTITGGFVINTGGSSPAILLSGAQQDIVNDNLILTKEGEVDCRMLSFEGTIDKTISGGIITISGGNGICLVDTEAAAASDDLDTITIDSSIEGRPLLILHAKNSARTVVVKHNTGNITLAGAADFSMDNADDLIVLLYTGTKWLEVCRADNGA